MNKVLIMEYCCEEQCNWKFLGKEIKKSDYSIWLKTDAADASFVSTPPLCCTTIDGFEPCAKILFEKKNGKKVDNTIALLIN